MASISVDTKVSVGWTELGQKVTLNKNSFQNILKWQPSPQSHGNLEKVMEKVLETAVMESKELKRVRTLELGSRDDCYIFYL